MSFSRAGATKLIQRTTVSMLNTASTSATITGVDPAKSELANLGAYVTAAGPGVESLTGLVFTSSVLITVNRGTTGSNTTVTSLQVTERY